MKNELNIRTVMSRDQLPVTGGEQVVFTLVDIKAGGGLRLGAVPANIGLVLDRSGSMDGEKMDNLKEAVGYVVDHLADDDLVSVTIFDDQVETIVPSRPAKDRDGIRSALAAVIPRGGTQIADGLKAGLEEVGKGISKDRVNRILLITDGQTWDDEAACLRLADEAAQRGVAITGIGLGEEWNEKLLLEIAGRSRGDSHWIQNPVAILDVFRQEVEGMQSVAATNLTATVRLEQGVQPLRVFTTVPLIADVTAKAVQGSAVRAVLGALDGRNGQALLIEARVPGRGAGPFRLGRLEIGYDIPSQGITGRRVTADLDIVFTNDAAAASRVNAEVMNLAERVTAFKLQTRALSEAEAGNIAAATRKFQAAATVLLDLGEDELARTVESEITSLEQTGALTSAGTKKLEYGTRKLTQAMTKAI